MTTLVTDCWNRYINLKYLGFIHLTVDHLKTLSIPQQGQIQAIENRWNIFERKITSRFITPKI
ncbi:hypothetical protein H311_02570 [Anncaliia algerae PRA109]|nr:hypothetical protein H311_02570 [Anncaliia algerae PRA109]